MSKNLKIGPELKKELAKCKTMDDLTGKDGLLQKLLGGMIEEMLEKEMDDHLGYEKHSKFGDNSGNSRNGKNTKTVKSNYGDIDISVPRDRGSSFSPKLVKKRKRDIGEFDQKIISMYAKGMSVRDIQQHIKEIYGANISPTCVSSITDRVLNKAHEWQTRTLDSIWAIIYFDAVHFKVKEAGVVVTKASYTAYGISLDGHREVLGIWVGESEGAAFWAGVFDELKHRGIEDILIACMDGLKGLPEALLSVFPKTEIQLCVIHMIRASLTRVPNKHYKEFLSDLKEVYQALNLTIAEEKLEILKDKWGTKYPHALGPWTRNWNEISTYFKFPTDLRKIIYTSNAVEGLHRRIRKVTKAKSVFPNDQALFKMLYLVIDDIASKGPIRVNHWKYVYSALVLHFPNRFEAPQS